MTEIESLEMKILLYVSFRRIRSSAAGGAVGLKCLTRALDSESKGPR